MVAKNLLNNSNGQALVEFLLFLPFMLMLYATISSIGNAINGSINQQKATRAYFYYVTQNNSMIPKPVKQERVEDAWRLFGMQIIGWKEKFANGTTPVATCYKFALPLGQTENDECDEGYAGQTTQFIRVGTVYGVCGATFSNEQNQIILLPGRSSSLTSVSNVEGCLLQ
jgi:hypothetical protein